MAEPLTGNPLRDNEQPLVDALPFVDRAIDDHEDVHAAARSAVDDEMETSPPDKDYLAHLPDISKRPFLTELLKKEIARIDACQTQNNPPIKNNLAEMKADIPPPASSMMDTDELELLRKCFDQLKIKLEYRHRQLINLELIRSYGSLAWEQYILACEQLGNEINLEQENLERRTQEVNWDRKSHQEKALRALNILKNEWNNLVDRNRELSREIARVRGSLVSR